MSRKVKIATIQPPFPEKDTKPPAVIRRGLDLLEEAATDGIDIACLPEYFNCMNVSEDDVEAFVTVYARDLRQQVRDIAARIIPIRKTPCPPSARRFVSARR